MHLPLGGGGRALFIVAETAVWLGMLSASAVPAAPLRPGWCDSRAASCGGLAPFRGGLRGLPIACGPASRGLPGAGRTLAEPVRTR